MTDGQPVATFDWLEGQLDDQRVILQALRTDLRELRFVRLWKTRLNVYDVNGDFILVRGLGYASPEVHRMLAAIGTAYNVDTIHDEPVRGEYKDFKTGRRYPWAYDRVM